jgi:hypothetical protein
MSGFSTFWDSFVQFGLEAFGRYYSIYRAKVDSNVDPENQGRIKIIVEAFGSTTPLLEYAYPITPFASKDAGMFFPPESGDQVYVMFENGNPRLPMYLGGWWMKGDLPSSFKKEPTPTVRGIETKSGHKILFDDSVTTPGIVVETFQGHKLFMSDFSGDLSISLTTAAGASIKLNDTQQTITISKTAGAPPLIQIDAAGQIKLFSQDADQAFVLGTQFIQDFIQHTHFFPDNVTPLTGIPVQLGMWTSTNIFGK